MSPMSRSYRSKTTSPYAMHRRWIEQDMDQNYVDEMRANDIASYYATLQDGYKPVATDGCPFGTDSDA